MSAEGETTVLEVEDSSADLVPFAPEHTQSVREGELWQRLLAGLGCSMLLFVAFVTDIFPSAPHANVTENDSLSPTLAPLQGELASGGLS